MIETNIPRFEEIDKRTARQLSLEKFMQIPDDFKSFNNFVVWESVPDPDGKKPKKVPRNPRDFGISGADEANKQTWADYDIAVAGYAKYRKAAGIGFVLNTDTMSHNLIAIDLDHVLNPETGEIDDWAQKILNTFADSYAEISYSGDGFHIFAYADWPDEDDNFSHKGTTLEIYRSLRYIALTGNIYEGRNQIATYSDEVKHLIAEYFPKREKRVKQVNDDYSLDYDQTMTMVKKDQKAWTLFKGEIPLDATYLDSKGNVDQSCADYSFACKLAFYTRDEDVIEQIMRESKLYRKKWDTNPTYLRGFTIAKAVDATVDYYMPLAARIEKAKETVYSVAELTTETVFNEAVIEALAILKRYAPLDFVKFEERFKKSKLGVRNLNAAISVVKLPWVVATTEDEQAEEFNLPVDLFIPSGWRITKRGVFTTCDRGSQNICTEPVIITGKQVCIDTGCHKFTLSWLAGGKWREITVPGSTAFDARKLVSLADYGFPASSENCRNLAKWLKDLESANKNLNEVRSVAQLGWCADGKFAPVDADIVVDATDGFERFLTGYRVAGTLDEWVQHANTIRQYLIPQAALAAAFAAPLLSLVGSRNFITYLWGPSRGGKSAALAAGCSVWGDPGSLPATFNATLTAVERLCSFYNDMPVFIDERQAAGSRPDFINNLVFMLGSGKSRGRGTKTGLQVQKTWTGLVVATGEQPLFTGSSTAGIATRCLELCGKPFENEDVARSVYEWTGQHYGHAGKVFIDAVKQIPVAKLQAAVMWVRKFINRITPGLSGSHTEFISVIGVADAIAGEFVFSESEKTAAKNSLRLAARLSKMLTRANEQTNAARAVDFIESWIATNSNLFSGEHNSAGEQSGKELWIVAATLDKALSEAGFSPDAVRKELREIKYIKEFEVDKKPMSTWKRRFNGGRPPMYCVIREHEEKETEQAGTPGTPKKA